MSVFRKVLLVICLMVFVSSAGVLLNYFINGAKEQSALEELGKLKVDREDLETENGTVIGKYADLYLANNDIIGWVTMEDTKIDYPVMQTQHENEYYLHRAFDGSESKAGTPFMDAVSDIFAPTCNFLVYGHNMNNGTMFRDLLKYEDEDFYKKHDVFKFDTIYRGGQGTYQILAVCYSQIYPQDSNNFKYYQYGGITTEEQFYEYVDGVKGLSIYDTGVSAEYGDQLVTLSTCAYHVEDGRFFIVGKRIDAKQLPPQ